MRGGTASTVYRNWKADWKEIFSDETDPYRPSWYQRRGGLQKSYATFINSSDSTSPRKKADLFRLVKITIPSIKFKHIFNFLRVNGAY